MEIESRITSVRARCTAVAPPAEDIANGKKEGPDEGWTRLGPSEVAAFCRGEGARLQHRGREGYDHVCAYYGEWAFDARDGSQVRCVTFLHYKISDKANKLLGSVQSGGGAKVFDIKGTDLLERYTELQKNNEVHVWRREKHGEIAIDFCIGHGEPQKKQGTRSMFSKLFSKLK